MADEDSTRMPLDTKRKDDPPLFRVSRELPLSWLIAGAVGFAGQAIALYYNQQQQGQLLQQQSTDIKVLTAKIDSLIDKRNEDAIKNIQRDNKIDRQGERIDTLESQFKQQPKGR